MCGLWSMGAFPQLGVPGGRGAVSVPHTLDTGFWATHQCCLFKTEPGERSGTLNSTNVSLAAPDSLAGARAQTEVVYTGF